MITVALIDPVRYNQFDALPCAYQHNGREYRIIRAEKLSDVRFTSSRGWKNAYDIAVTHMQDPHWSVLSINEPESIINLKRFDKLTQQLLLTHFFSNLKTDERPRYYQPLTTYRVDLEKLTYGEYQGKCVIKPDCGARSMGVMKLDTRNTNLRQFLIALYELKNDKAKTNGKLSKLCDSFNVSVCLGKQYREDETVEVIFDEGLVLQDLNELEDVQELRVLRTMDHHLHIFMRDHFENDNQNITDSLIDPRPSAMEFTQGGLDGYTREQLDMMHEIQRVLSKADFPLIHGSIDVWYSLEAMQWGIYEYQTQYGHNFIPQDIHAQFLRDTIESFAVALYKCPAPTGE